MNQEIKIKMDECRSELKEYTPKLTALRRSL